jgi:DNA polymerase (family 10)
MWALWRGEADDLIWSFLKAGRRNCEEYIRSVREVQCGGMLLGIELDVLTDGRPVFADDLLGELDVRVGAIHGVRAVEQRRPLREVIVEYKRQASALMRVGIHVLAHPFRQMLSARYKVPHSLLGWLVSEAARFRVALELNSHARFPETDLAMARMALQAGVQLAAGTDAHRSGELNDFAYQAEISHRAGADPDDLSSVFWDGP